MQIKLIRTVINLWGIHSITVRLKIDYSPEKISLTAPNVGGSLERGGGGEGGRHGRMNFKDTNPLMSSLLVIFVWGGEAI
jgi:hypothetical protein